MPAAESVDPKTRVGKSKLIGVQSRYPAAIYNKLVAEAKRERRSIHRQQEKIVIDYLEKMAHTGNVSQ